MKILQFSLKFAKLLSTFTGKLELWTNSTMEGHN